MPVRAERSEVKFKVRRNALLLGEFTIAKLVRATGLNPESVRTEVQRLRKEGFVVSERIPGRREASYRLSDDPEQRLALSHNVEAFYPEPLEPIQPRPTSRMYQAALESLDQAEVAEGRHRNELLKQADHQLEGAWQAERASRVPELVQAHILRERGRLAYLQGQQRSAQELLTQARKIFDVAGLESETRLIDEYLLCIEAWRRMQASHASGAAAQIRCVLEVLQIAEHRIAGPLARLLADLAEELTDPIINRVAGEVFAADSHRKFGILQEQLHGLEDPEIQLALKNFPKVLRQFRALIESTQPPVEGDLYTEFERHFHKAIGPREKNERSYD